MATKFSEFVAGATTENTLVVGFDSNLNTNNKYTLSQLGSGLASFIPTFYSLDGSLPSDATRTVTMPGTANIIFTGGTGNNNKFNIEFNKLNDKFQEKFNKIKEKILNIITILKENQQNCDKKLH